MTPVEFQFNYPDGRPIAGMEFVIKLPKSGFIKEADGIIMPADLTFETDEQGFALVLLAPSSSVYTVRMTTPGQSEDYDSCRKGVSYKFYVPDSAEPVRAQDLFLAPPPNSEPWDETAIRELTEAKVIAVQSAETAVAASVSAEASAVRAEAASAGIDEDADRAERARDASEAFAIDALAAKTETDADRIAAQQAALDAGNAADVKVKQLETALAAPGGTNKLNFARSKPNVNTSSVTRLMSARQYSIWEFDYAITDRTDPNPSNWDWSQAGAEANIKARDGFVYWPSYISYRFASMVKVPVNATYWTNHVGNVGLTTIVLDPTVPTAFAFADSVPGDTVRKIRIGGFVVDASKTDGTDGAIIFGGRQNRKEAVGLNYEDIYLFDCRHFGASSDTTAGNFRLGIQMSAIFNSVNDTPTVMRNIFIDRMRFEGGITGLYMGAGVPASNNAPLWMDEIHITDFFHDTLVTNAGYPAAGIQIGQDGKGGKLRITRAYCYNGGDVGIEHNGFLDPVLEDCHMFNPGSGFWSFNYQELPDYKKQKAVWRDCSVTGSRKNPAWRIGQTRAGHLLLDNCTVYITEDSDPRALDFSASSLQGLESLTIKNLKVYVTTKAKIDYISLAAALSLGANFAEYSLNIDGFDIYYDGVAPREAHECAAMILNSTTAGAIVRADIKGFRVHDKRTSTLLNSDAVRIYGTAKVYGTVSSMIVDSTVNVPAGTGSRRGVAVVGASVPAPELKIKDSDLSGCTSLFELNTSTTTQRSNVLFDNVKFNQQFDATTQPSSPVVTVGDFLYKNTKGQPLRIIVTGGTVSALSISQDGVTYYPLGKIAGDSVLMPNETFKISSTVVPQLRVIVLTRLVS